MNTYEEFSFEEVTISKPTVDSDVNNNNCAY